MITNVIISRMEKSGIQIFKALYPYDNFVQDAIIHKAFQDDAKSRDLTIMSLKRSVLYTTVFMYQDDLSKRANLYGLHILSNYKMAGLDKVLLGLSIRFERLGLHRLDHEQFMRLHQALMTRQGQVILSFNTHPISLELLWED